MIFLIDNAREKHGHVFNNWLEKHGILKPEKPLEYIDLKPSISSQEATKRLEILRNTENKKNKVIKKYLDKNPHEDMGKFGVPQDKYRHGFYGSNSMEYDVWGKGEK